jgi:hypothetical protein
MQGIENKGTKRLLPRKILIPKKLNLIMLQAKGLQATNSFFASLIFLSPPGTALPTVN